MFSYSLNISGRLLSMDSPLVMGIVNVTPDSFAVRCSSCSASEVLAMSSRMLQEGADILDIGGCSTRPGGAVVTEAEEWRRVETALRAIRETWPDVVLSVDTWRSGVARRAIEEYGGNIINDVSGGQWDSDMFSVIARARVPYIITHAGWLAPDQRETAKYTDGVLSSVLHFLQQRLDMLRQMGVADVVIDPGFGFGKTLEENWEILRNLQLFRETDAPLLVGISRKSMLCKLLDITPSEALNATTAAHIIALQKGAGILRVHDVKAAKEAIKIYEITRNAD